MAVGGLKFFSFQPEAEAEVEAEVEAEPWSVVGLWLGWSVGDQ